MIVPALVAGPLAAWALAGGLLRAIGVLLAFPAPDFLTPVTIFAAGSLTALGHACQLRFRASFWMFPMTIGFLTGMSRTLLIGEGVQRELVLAAAGLLALVSATILNRRTLRHATSASRAYSRPQMPFGLPGTPTR